VSLLLLFVFVLCCLALMSATVTAFGRITRSLLATILGWLAGLVYYLAITPLVSGFGRVTDLEAIAYWTAVFSGLAWLLLVLPLVLLMPASSRLFAPRRAWLVGAVGGLAAFLGLVGWWTGFWREPLYLGYALIVGSVTGMSYSLLRSAWTGPVR